MDFMELVLESHYTHKTPPPPPITIMSIPTNSERGVI